MAGNGDRVNEIPRGRPPKCYAKAYRFSECETCTWRFRCSPKAVPVQSLLHYDSTLDPPYEIVPTTLEKKAV